MGETFDVAGHLGPGPDRHRRPRFPGTRTPIWRQTNEISVYACQISLSATNAGAATRQHWSIENRSHYVRDVSFFEDLGRIRTKPRHFDRCRFFALNILRANAITNVAQEPYINALNPDNALSYLVT